MTEEEAAVELVAHLREDSCLAVVAGLEDQGIAVPAGPGDVRLRHSELSTETLAGVGVADCTGLGAPGMPLAATVSGKPARKAVPPMPAAAPAMNDLLETARSQNCAWPNAAPAGGAMRMTSRLRRLIGPPPLRTRPASALVHRFRASPVNATPGRLEWSVLDNAIDFELPDQDGHVWDLGDHLARGPVIVVFYRGDW